MVHFVGLLFHITQIMVQGKIPMAEVGIEPETSRSVVKNSDH
jgi:hypothetical protein